VKVFLNAIGCRLNQSEVDTLARQLLASGHEIVTSPDEADKVIVNTCMVTREAASDSRALTRRYHRRNPSAELILTGCYATVVPEELEQINGVGRIVPNMEKDQLIQLLDPTFPVDIPIYDREPVLRDYLISNIGRTRAFIKVQDGCDNRCTYCITTLARGRNKSRRVGDIVSEIQGLAAAGYKEAVLTGVHLGSYGMDLEAGVRLIDLVRSVLEHTDILRLRLSSLEPWDVPEGFFELWSNPRLLPHLHVPLQSGSDRILKRMARRTDRSSFRRLASSARGSIPDLNLSTDLIAGFPGESDRDFEDTVEYVSEMGFSRLHVFTYSNRPGTAAEKMDDQIPKKVRKQRVRRLIDLGKQFSLEFHQSNEGRTLSVLWETVGSPDADGHHWLGYSENYIRIRADSKADLSNQITQTYVSGATSEGLSGVVRLSHNS
jgi:threonylcarbamoyladenosine tRNA methylthiotransferase MtaB